MGSIPMVYTNNLPALMPPETPSQMRKLFIGGLPYNCSRDDLFRHFVAYGSIQDAAVMVNSETNIPRGFGFITYMNEESVHAAMLSRPHIIQGKTVDVKRAIPKQQLQNELPPPDFNFKTSPDSKVFISSILDRYEQPVDWGYRTIKNLHEYFSQFGNLEQIEETKEGERFLLFENKMAVEDCLAFNGGIHVYNNMTILLEVSRRQRL